MGAGNSTHPIHRAGRSGDLNVVRRFLEKPAILNRRDLDDMTCLHWYVQADGCCGSTAVAMSLRPTTRMHIHDVASLCACKSHVHPSILLPKVFISSTFVLHSTSPGEEKHAGLIGGHISSILTNNRSQLVLHNSFGLKYFSYTKQLNL